jgi:hypothetical protein
MKPTFTQQWDDRIWTLVRADQNIAGDVMIGGIQTTLTLRWEERNDKEGFRVATVNSEDKVPVSLADLVLEPVGAQVPNLGTAGLEPLPVYQPKNAQHEAHYCKALDHGLIPYFTSNPNLMRLEGTMKMRCPWPRKASQGKGQASAPHYVDTDVKFYQFENGISRGTDGSATLLVIWAPDSPRLPTNPDGSVMGIA